MAATDSAQNDPSKIPATVTHAGASRFWLAVALTGVAAGIGGGVLTKFLEIVQHAAWSGSGTDILPAASADSPLRRVLVLLGAGAVIGLGQLILRELTSANSIDITTAIWFTAGRVPILRTLGSAVLSIIGVGMGASLGREGAPKQAGAVFANLFSDQSRLSDEQRRLLVACGAGAGMAAAYGVPLGGALFALEVLRGMLALRLILPALFCSLLATAVSWLFLPDAPVYHIPSYSNSSWALLIALVVGPIAGLLAVAFIRAIAWAERYKPKDWQRYFLPLIALGGLGLLSIPFPQLLGNGSDTCQLLFTGGIASFSLLVPLLLLKPAVVTLLMRSGTPGGLFTPTLTVGALLGGTIGLIATHFLPQESLGLSALLGGGALLAATTQGPISAVVLVMELTGRDRSFIAPLLLAVCLSTIISRTIEPRSIYEVRLTDEEVKERLKAREPSAQ